MLSKLFVLSVAQLCTKKVQTEDGNSSRAKYEEIKTTKILAQKENTFEKYLRAFRWIL